ncbi:MAG: hypothetical protein ACTSW1_07250 [Candidatus Hodarchaeales archaeon]
MSGGPVFTSMSEIWNPFIYNLSFAFSFTSLIGLFILALFTYFVARSRGVGSAVIVVLIGIPIIVSMGLLPSWTRLISYTIVAIFGVRLYAKSTEGF